MSHVLSVWYLASERFKLHLPPTATQMENQDILAQALNKLYSRDRPSRIVGFEDEEKGIYEMLESTVTLRRGDSCLIVGPRNSGKTLIVDHCIHRLEEKFPKQALIIRLNGFLHSDDRMAFREIARQLDVVTGEDQAASETIEKVSMHETLRAVIQLFERAEHEAYLEGTKRISVIFVLEEMDKLMTGARQSLLYNLLDFSKNSSLGVAFIGISTKLNAQEGLEKRVRSRFGALVFNTTRARTKLQFNEIALALLQSDDNENQQHKTWNENVARFLSGPLQQVVDYVYYTSKDPRELGCILAPLIQKHFRTIMDGSDFPATVELEALNIPTSTETRIQGLCELDWALLISAARCQIKYGITDINLVLADIEYREMASQLSHERSLGLSHSGYRTWSPRAVRLSWERLQSLSLIALPPASASTHKDLRSYRLDTSLDELRMLVPEDHPLHPWTRL